MGICPKKVCQKNPTQIPSELRPKTWGGDADKKEKTSKRKKNTPYRTLKRKKKQKIKTKTKRLWFLCANRGNHTFFTVFFYLPVLVVTPLSLYSKRVGKFFSFLLCSPPRQTIFHLYSTKKCPTTLKRFFKIILRQLKPGASGYIWKKKRLHPV